MNDVLFRQGKVDIVEIFSMTQLNAWLWIKHKIFSIPFSYADWYQCPIQYLKTL